MSAEIIESEENRLEDVPAEAQGQEESLQGDIPTELEEEEEVVDIISWKYYRDNDLLEYLKNTDPRKDKDKRIMEQTSLLSYIEIAKTTDESAERIIEMLEKAYKFNIRQQKVKPYKDKDDWEDVRDDFNDALTEEYGTEIYDQMVSTALSHIRDKTGDLVL